MNPTRFLILAILLLLITLFFGLGGHRELSLESLQLHYDELSNLVTQHPWTAGVIYLAAYTLITALSLPGAVPLTLLGGSLFGLIGGTLLVSFASTIGATVAFLLARFLFGEHLRQRFHGQVKAIVDGFNNEGDFFLFALRLSPIFPFFVVNLLMGLTSISPWRYYLISQLGMLPGTIVYVNAGRELTRINSYGDILSLEFMLSFSALGILPWISAKALHYFRKQRDT